FCCSRRSFSSTLAVCAARHSITFFAVFASPVPMICAASTAAFTAPSMPTVATGTPGGICDVLSSASRPFSAPEATGMPITGRALWAATAPARCAAMPAAQMNTFTPLASACCTNSRVWSGVRCAESTRPSTETPSSFSVVKPASSLGRSLSDPISQATCAMDSPWSGGTGNNFGPLTLQPVNYFPVSGRGAFHDFVGQVRRRRLLVPGLGFEPVAHDLLVEALRVFADRVGLGVPEAAAVGRQHLITDRQVAVDHAELELGVG